MSGAGELVVGLVIAVGLIGVIIQVLPGSLIVLAAIGVWAALTGGAAAWVAFGIGLVAVVVAAVVKFLVAGRHLKRANVPNGTLIWGGIAGVVGFFVIPVVGLPVGFVAGVYGAELVRRRDGRLAWRATVAALQATGWTILIELAGALIASGAWLVAVLFAT